MVTMRHARVWLACGLALGVMSGAARAQVFNWATGNGVWSVSGNWNPIGVPNAATHSAVLGGSGSYTTTLDIPANLADLDITNANATLAMQDGRYITTTSTSLIDSGNILVNSTAGGNSSYIQFNSSCSLDGNGRITLNANANLDTAYLNANGVTLTNSTGHTITGRGRIFGAFNNQGDVFVSGSTNQIDLAGSPVTNSGLLRAINGGLLTPRGPVTQTGLGRIGADGGTVYLYGTTYTGGQILNTGAAGSDLRTVGVATLNGVATQGDLLVADSTAVVFATTMDHNGTIRVNTGGGNGAYLQFNSGHSIIGNASIVLNANANLDTAYVNANGVTMTLPSTTTITGRGRINGAWVNNSLIEATGAGKQIDFTGSPITNNGTIRASNGAIVTPRGPVTQSGGGQLVADGGTVPLYNTVYSGGSIARQNGGSIYTVNGPVTLSNVVYNGNLDVTDGTAVVYPQSFTHNGNLLVNPTAGGNGAYLQFNQGITPGGSGVITLNANANLDTAYVNANGVTVTLPNTWSIVGRGRINGAWVNNSLIEATGAGKQIDFTGSPITNNGTIRASNGAIVTPRGPVTQSGGGQLVADGGTVPLYNTVYSGGSIARQNGGSIYTTGGPVTLSNVVYNGNLDVSEGTAVVYPQSFTHNGNLLVNSTAGGNGAYLQFNQGITPGGSGVITLNANANLDTAYVNANGVTVTLPNTWSIVGRGRINGAWVNNSLIEATGAGKQIDFTGSPITNNGTIRASNGAIVTPRGPVTQSGGGQLVADGGTVPLYNTVYSGGSIARQNGGSIYTVNGPVTLSNVVYNGNLDVTDGTAVVYPQSFTHNGNLLVNPTAGGNGAYLQFNQGITPGGSGVITLNANANLDTAYVNANGVTVTWPVTRTLMGRGRLFGTHILQGNIVPGTAGTVNTLDFRGSVTLTSSAVVSMDVASSSSFDRLTSGNPLTLAGTLTISAAGYTPALGDRMAIINTTGTLSGQFAVINLPATGNPDLQYGVVQTAQTVTLGVFCISDNNFDGVIDLFDYLDFVVAFAANDPSADFNHDGVIDFFDYLDFVAAFAAGC